MDRQEQIKQLSEIVSSLKSDPAYQADRQGGKFRTTVDQMEKRLASLQAKTKAVRQPLTPEQQAKVDRTTQAGMYHAPKPSVAGELADSAAKTAATVFYSNPVTRVANDMVANAVNDVAFLAGHPGRHMQTVDEYLGDSEEQQARNLLTAPGQVIFSGGTAPIRQGLVGASAVGRTLAKPAEAAAEYGGAAMAPVNKYIFDPVMRAAQARLGKYPVIAGAVGAGSGGAVLTAADRALRNQDFSAEGTATGALLPAVLGAMGGYSNRIVDPNRTLGKETAQMVATKERAKAIPEDYPVLKEKMGGRPGPDDLATGGGLRYENARAARDARQALVVPAQKKAKAVVEEAELGAKQTQAERTKRVALEEGAKIKGLGDRFQKEAAAELEAMGKAYGAVKKELEAHPEAHTEVTAATDKSAPLRDVLEGLVKKADVTGKVIDKDTADRANEIIKVLFGDVKAAPQKVTETVESVSPILDPHGRKQPSSSEKTSQVSRVFGNKQSTFHDLYNMYRTISDKWLSGTPAQRFVAEQIKEPLKEAMFNADPTGGTMRAAHAKYKEGSEKLERLTGYMAGKGEKEIDTGVPQEIRIATNLNKVAGGSERDLLSQDLQQMVAEHAPWGREIIDEAKASKARQSQAEQMTPEELMDIGTAKNKAEAIEAEAKDPEYYLRKAKDMAGDENIPAEERLPAAEELYQKYEARPEAPYEARELEMKRDLEAKGLEQDFSLHMPAAEPYLQSISGRNREHEGVTRAVARNLLMAGRGAWARNMPLPMPGESTNALQTAIPNIAALRLKYGPGAEMALKAAADRQIASLRANYEEKKKKLKDAVKSGVSGAISAATADLNEAAKALKDAADEMKLQQENR